jgi:hypothetical protein
MKNIKEALIGFYVLIAILVCTYGTFFGDYAHKGVAYNLGRSLIWPAVIFPSLGHAIGGVLIVAFIAYITIFAKKS